MQIPSRVRNIGDSNEASALNFKAMVGRLIGVFVMDSVAEVRISVRQRPPEIRNEYLLICQFPCGRQRRYEPGILSV